MGLCTYFPQVTASGSDPWLCPSDATGGGIAWGKTSKQGSCEDYSPGSGFIRFTSSTLCCCSFYIYDQKYLEARCSAGVNQWSTADLYQLESWPLCSSGKGMGGKGERLYLVTSPLTFLLGKYLHMLTNAN